MTIKTTILACSILLSLVAGTNAEPILQIYLQGASYDAATETWIAANSSSPLRLWVIAQSPVSDVKLSAAYASGEAPTITLTGSTTGGYGGFTDPSVASDPTFIQTVADGSSPILSDGSSLAPHGIYETGKTWQEFALGDFTLTDSQIADFMTSLPPPSNNKWGQINVYDVSISGASAIHFDVYDHVGSANHAKFAPFSHDGGTGPSAPVPGAALLGLIGMSTLGVLRRRLGLVG